jgi:nitroimidazol reductase NimA-like FMN-containing flavoprotein (pyridoxamine 5'-phosphate oxidase superfamily)
MTANPPTDFTRVKRMAQRASYERDTIYAILDAAPFCHIGHLINGRPVVVPTLHWRAGDYLFWHGSAASRMLETNASGSEICLTATLLDGWVLARSAFNHSANYRSAMCLGKPVAVGDPDEKRAALKAFVETRFPGRWERLRPMTEKEFRATLVLSMKIDEASAKLRAEGVDDPASDLGWPVWAGVLPLKVTRGVAIADGLFEPPLSPPDIW